MSTYPLPLPISTHHAWWQRAIQRVREAWRRRSRQAAATDQFVSDWDALRDLPDSLQRDIGVPESLREHGRQVRERDALWLHV